MTIMDVKNYEKEKINVLLKMGERIKDMNTEQLQLFEEQVIRTA